MTTIIEDLYGSRSLATVDLDNSLQEESAWTDLFDYEKDAFRDWVIADAHIYRDGDKVDWVGAFYDWLEEA